MKNRSGQSLIEVLVAIAVLIFGVFSVLRLFPVGFRMITQTASQGQVQQLSDDLAQTARNGQLQASDGIVERVQTADGKGWFVPAQSFPASGNNPPSIPPESLKQNTVTQNALFSQRTILGERLALQVTGSPSLLLFGPTYFVPNTGVDYNIQVYDPNGYQDVTALDPGAPEPTGQPRTFEVDANNKTIFFSVADPDFNAQDPANGNAAVPRFYLLSYRTLVGGVPYDIVDEPLSVGAGATKSAAFAQGQPLPGSVQLFRSFPSGDGTKGTFNLIDAYTGIIQIQPYSIKYQDANGYDYFAAIPAFNQKLAVDYTTQDWQILRLDRDVPGDDTIHLPVTGLDILDRFVNATTRILAINLSRPAYFDNAQKKWFPNIIPISAVVVPGTAPAAGTVNVRDGIVYLPPSWPDGSSTVGTPVRIYYAAYNTWAEQPVVSYRSYTPSPTADPGYRFFTVTPDLTTAANPTANLPRTVDLLFTVADVGKMVNVDFQYTDANGGLHQVYGQSTRIEGGGLLNGVPTVASAAIQYNGQYGFNGNALNGTLIINQVAGISYQARGMYLETGDVRRTDDPTLPINQQIWNPSQIGRLGETTEDVYVPRT